MTKPAKTLEFEFQRTIPAPPGEVFDAWLNPKIPGNPWHTADKLILILFRLNTRLRHSRLSPMPSSL